MEEMFFVRVFLVRLVRKRLEVRRIVKLERMFFGWRKWYGECIG